MIIERMQECTMGFSSDDLTPSVIVAVGRNFSVAGEAISRFPPFLKSKNSFLFCNKFSDDMGYYQQEQGSLQVNIKVIHQSMPDSLFDFE